jgi:hypothetical protein
MVRSATASSAPERSRRPFRAGRSRVLARPGCQAQSHSWPARRMTSRSVPARRRILHYGEPLRSGTGYDDFAGDQDLAWRRDAGLPRSDHVRSGPPPQQLPEHSRERGNRKPGLPPRRRHPAACQADHVRPVTVPCTQVGHARGPRILNGHESGLPPRGLDPLRVPAGCIPPGLAVTLRGLPQGVHPLSRPFNPYNLGLIRCHLS